MIGLKDTNEGFSSVYKILTDQKIYKIYNQRAFLNISEINYQNSKDFMMNYIN